LREWGDRRKTQRTRKRGGYGGTTGKKVWVPKNGPVSQSDRKGTRSQDREKKDKGGARHYLSDGWGKQFEKRFKIRKRKGEKNKRGDGSHS